MMRKISILVSFVFVATYAFSQQRSGTVYGLMTGSLLKGKWHYSSIQNVNSRVDFSDERITIRDSSGTFKYRLLKDVVTKHMDEDSCIASLRTGYDKDNVRCMINLVEFNNGVNVLNILYANVSYSYYFRYAPD